MASLSAAGDELVIRLVYDGPPESGKTSSLRTLAGGLARPLESPAEAGGRTLFFDWVDYVGGSFEGLPIRCQIVSVPGQQALASRREILLSEADAVVFVADSTRSAFSASEDSIRGLRVFLESSSQPRPGIVVQANKRDQADALPLRELRHRLGLEGVAVVESVAIAGTGLREAFVLGVRLALDRVRELKARGQLLREPLRTANARDLLRFVKSSESERGRLDRSSQPHGANEVPAAEQSFAGSALHQLLEQEARAEGTAAHSMPAAGQLVGFAARGVPSQPPGLAPALPDSSVPSGRVWPPIEGRLLLHAASEVPLKPQLRSDGSWGAQESEWWFHSAPHHEFRQLEAGKEELLRWAQLHAGNVSRLSPRRCLVLSEAAPGVWRLWQIVQPQPSLRQRLREAFQREAPRVLARTLVGIVDAVLRARILFAREPVLPCLLEVICLGTAQPTYGGLLPPRNWTPPKMEEERDDLVFLRRLLGPAMRQGLEESPLDVPLVLNALTRESSVMNERGSLVELLAELLIGR